MSIPISHRAEAELALANAHRSADSINPKLEQTFLQYALVHATLAAGQALGMAARPKTDDSGWRDLLSAARVLVAHASHDLYRDTVVISAANFNALVEQVNEATEAGL